MTEDQKNIRRSALKASIEEYGLTMELLILCLKFTEKVKNEKLPNIFNPVELNNWGKKQFEIMESLKLSKETFGKFMELDKIATSYGIQIVLVDNRVKFRI